MVEIDYRLVDNNKPIAIVGESDSGKTNLLIYLSKLCKSKKQIVILGYPIKLEGIDLISSTDDFNKLSNCVLLIDEFGIYIDKYEHGTNKKLQELIRLCAHNNVKLIVSTQISQDFDKTTESLIKTWICKQINIHTLKNGSSVKKSLQSLKHSNINSMGIRLEQNEYTWVNYESKVIGENRIYDFPYQNIGKDYTRKNDMFSTLSVENPQNNSQKSPDGKFTIINNENY